MELQQRLADFVRERDWEQFHQPKNLVLALTGEVGELAAAFQWLSDKEIGRLGDDRRQEIADELADVQIYLMLLARRLNLDLLEVTGRKMRLNAEKYPAERFRGSAKKYDDD